MLLYDVDLKEVKRQTAVPGQSADNACLILRLEFQGVIDLSPRNGADDQQRH